MNTTPLIFTLTRRSLPVTIDGEPYALRVMNGRDRDAFLQDMDGRFRRNEKGEPTGIAQWVDMKARLISLCLVSGEGKGVTVDTIQQWPGDVVEQLYTAAQELNGLDKKPSENIKEAKKD